MTDTLSIPQIRALSRIKFRNWLQDKRNPLGLTLAQIGEKAGVTRQRVSQVEKGVCLPSEAYSEQWASAYGVGELEFLMKGGVMPVWAIHLLAWDHFEAFKEFLSSLVESDAETTDEVGGLNNA
jgi:transcriptional regulator with XRE-family HTH domain